MRTFNVKDISFSFCSDVGLRPIYIINIISCRFMCSFHNNFFCTDTFFCPFLWMAIYILKPEEEMKGIINVRYEIWKAGPLPILEAQSMQLLWSSPMHYTHDAIITPETWLPKNSIASVSQFPLLQLAAVLWNKNFFMLNLCKKINLLFVLTNCKLWFRQFTWLLKPQIPPARRRQSWVWEQ